MFVDFKAIMESISFKKLLDHLNIPYTETESEVLTDDIVVNKKKKLFFYKSSKKGGSIIQYVADTRSCRNYEAAKWLRKTFEVKKFEPKRKIPELELHYCDYLEAEGVSADNAKKLNIGLVKSRGIMAGKVAFKAGQHYIGYDKKKKSWFFPKGFKRDFLYSPYEFDDSSVICVVGALEVAQLYEKGFRDCVALMGKSATDEQIKLLAKYRQVWLMHPEPSNIVLRLAKETYVSYTTEPSINLMMAKVYV